MNVDEKKLDQFYQSFIKALENLDKDFEVLLGSNSLKVVASLSNKFFQKRAAQILNAFSEILELYQEEYETLVLEHFTPMSIEGRELLNLKEQQYKKDLTMQVQRLNVKAQILIEDLEASQLQLEPDTKLKLEEIRNITVDKILTRFKTG